MATRSLRHAVIIWVDPDGACQWDHSQDDKLLHTLTDAQRDSVEMIYRYGYTSARDAVRMVEAAKAKSAPRLKVVNG